MRYFAVRYGSGKCDIVEREARARDVRQHQLNEWFAVSRDAYELWTMSIDEAIKVAKTMCYAVRQEFAELTVQELWSYREAYYRELDKHSFRIERQRYLEALMCIEEELRDKLATVEDVEFSHGWRLGLAKRFLDDKELKAIGYVPEDFLMMKRLYPVEQPSA
ncbi:hypothetical protein HZC53_04885 [Candidatus Uhrbacteria bacterium]|nr:hypothetical protein [Candidatus Uhrbacteria bacterium]